MPAVAVQPGRKVARTFSLEATRPSIAEVGEVAAIVARNTPLYLTSVTTQSLRELAELAAVVRKAGLEPVAHLAARGIANVADLKDFLARVRGEADLRRLLVIAGEIDAHGPFADALAAIQGGGLRQAGIEEIGIAGYPEGHHRFTPEQIAAAFAAKIAAAEAEGLRVRIVSQFSFDPAGIVAWLRQLRASGITLPVNVGMAGPTSLPALLRYAKRCGVKASLHGLMSGAAAALVGHVGPDRIIEALDAAGDEVGDVVPHYFSFGGLLQTARYARDMAAAQTFGGRAINPSN
jgi:methylenetetrahydrofolate reductase (NADPH)